MSNSSTSLEHFVNKAGQLYSLPAVAMEVLELTSNPKVDVPALKLCIENDPALTTKVLRVVNSSLFGLSREVSDLSQALSLLGTKPLKLLVLGFSLPERLFQGIAAETLGRHWRHTLTKAVAARELAGLLGGQSGDEAFIAGLLQDLGVLLLIQEVGDPYVQFLQKVHDRGSDLAAMETALLGFDHTQLTSRLLGHWGLPDVLVDAVRRVDPPPGPGGAPCSTLGDVVHWAGLVAKLLADGHSDALVELLALDDASAGLSREQLDELIVGLEEKVEQLAEVLSLRLPAGRDYRDVLVEAHTQLAQIAAEVAGDLVVEKEAPEAVERESRAFEDEFRSLSDAVARVAQTPPTATKPEAPETASANAPKRPAAAAPRSASVDTAACSAEAAHGTPSAVATVEATLLEPLHAAVADCRRAQCALTLLLVEFDEFPRLASTFGAEGVRKLRLFLETTCRDVDHPQASCHPHGDHGFAVILPDCERQPAVRLGNQLIDRVRQVAPSRRQRGRSVLSISVGAATVSVPSRNFPPEDLVEGADRCLHGSQASGGGVVKSIEIY
jgi:HD-like signal output (HDOD) protein/GGDEF domain-containing protein